MGENEVPDLVCASCGKEAKSACAGCHLVLYCGVDCQKAHLAKHKTICKSPLLKESWKPDWVTQNRQPGFIGDGSQQKFGVPKHYWGNVPAIDIVQMKANEGESYKGELSLLFAGM